MKKGNRAKKAHYKGYSMSPLEKLKRHGSKVLNPFAAIGGITHPSSWVDECVPNVLWAVIVVSAIDRAEYLNVFRSLLNAARDNVPKHAELYVTHNFLSVASNDEFDAMMKPVLDDSRLYKPLTALLAVDGLPDRAHWARHLKLGDKDAAFQLLAASVNNVFDHQSQRSTDIRWLKVMYMLYCREQMKFDVSMRDRVEEILGYPDIGDQRSVRPSVRSVEIGLRAVEFQLEGTDKHWPNSRHRMSNFDPEVFWQQVFEGTQCLGLSSYPSGEIGPKEISGELSRAAGALSDRYMQTIVTTKADPKHEAVFGLSLFALHMALICSSSSIHSQVVGHIALRTIMESFILLHYLVKEDKPALWLQYRKYGTGQTKLAFLKYMKEENLPDFIDLDELHKIANEDRWMELEDIDLGHWAGSNLRKMADSGGVKDVYDKFYDWSSGYVHGQWASARSTVFVSCLNPLHRFHLIPSPQVLEMPSVLGDACKLINRMLDHVNAMYPPFKVRLAAYKSILEGEADESIKIVPLGA
ncbi:DUF5677 domain-containing protein [Mesorhizobium sp.]|uniref:DUF5677 domain-containing protein n=1 Tax=Mesorhizobium sp. TaxID=1871066 RepID=UPI000FE4CDD0|nr:DUF5677 domain-containing protein [Mesorhizobium sp.]RWE77785.1 MAG: hypothetical protein EOS42_07185 [Mesorhizobium sp.]TIV29856.1 MAG: hypothetical protein E5V90_10700 [Mesorhizobium sp.]